MSGEGEEGGGVNITYLGYIVWYSIQTATMTNIIIIIIVIIM